MSRLATQDLDHVLEQARDCWPSLAGSRLFITGGTGFIGKWLLESLLWANDRLDLKISATVLTRDPDRFAAGSPHLASHSAVELLQGSAPSFEFPRGEFPFVIHAATERAFAADAAHPTSTFDLDVAATRRVLEFAGQHGARRLLFTSSGAVYGRQPSDLTHIPENYAGAPDSTDPGTAYGQSKRVSEFLCTMYGRQYGFDAPIARLFAFVGPHLPLDENFAVGNFIRDALEGGPIRVKGDGTPYRSYLYAADMAAWLWTILVRGEPARPYNVGSGDAVTIAELASVVEKAAKAAGIAGPGMRIETAEKAVAGMSAARYVPSVERAEKSLNLRAAIPLEEGVRRTLDWAASAGTSAKRLTWEEEAV